MKNSQKLTIGLVIYPGMTTMDFGGPHQVFNSLPNRQLHQTGADLVSKAMQFWLNWLKTYKPELVKAFATQTKQTVVLLGTH